MGFSRNQNQVRPFNQKQKLLIGDIKQSVEVFIKDYNNYFFENFFSKIFGNLQNVIDEKNEKKEISIKNYNLQINEMEGLMKQGQFNIIDINNIINILYLFLESDDNYKESIADVIRSLNDEKQKEIEAIEEEYKIKIENLKKDFSNNLPIFFPYKILKL